MPELRVLDLPLILEKVLRNLDVNDLLRCRRAGPKHLWNKEACKILKERVQVELHEAKSLRKLLKAFKSSIPGISVTPQNFNVNLRMVPLDKFSKLFQVIGKQIYKLQLLVGHAVMQRENLKKLLELVYSQLPNLKELSITYDEKMSASRPATGLQSLMACFEKKYLPKLKSITVIPSRYHGDTEKGQVSVLGCFVNTIIGSAINLECVFFQRPDRTSSSHLKQPLLQGAISKIISPYFKEITVNGMGTSLENVRSLTSHATLFQLGTVHLEMDTMTMNRVDLSNFLSRYRNSLQKLHLKFNYRFKMCFPLNIFLKRLSHLALENLHGSIEWTKLPQLKHLRLEKCLIEDDWVPPRDSEQLVPLPKDISAYMPSNFLISLALVNISYDLSFGHIFSECKKLQRLELSYCYDVTNESLCGMKAVELEGARWRVQDLRPEDDLLDDKIQGMVKEAGCWTHDNPFIGDLKELRSIILTADRYVSEVVLLFGLIYCKKLVEMDFCCNAMRPDIVSCIISHAGLVNLTRGIVNNSEIKLRK